MKMVIEIDEALVADAKKGHVKLTEIADAVVKTGKPCEEAQRRTHMTLYEYLKMQNNGYLSVDTYDKDYDAVVTIDAEIEDEGKSYGDDENYYKFIFSLLRAVEVVSFGKDSLVCDWSGLVENNMTIFREFSKEHWNSQYEDDDEEFIYQWIRELHYYYAGYVGESTYKAFREEVLEKIGEKNNA